MNKKNWPWLVVSIVVVIIDQLSKYWAQLWLAPYQPKPLLPMLNLTLAYNKGAAFSFLSNSGGWQRWFFAGFSIVMSIVLIIWLMRIPRTDKLKACAVSLILGGAVGNLYDRAFLGNVIDFIEVFYKNYHWPVFNLADSAICVGAFLLLIDLCKNPS